MLFVFFFFQAEDGIRDKLVTGVQTCALPIYRGSDGQLLGAKKIDAGRTNIARDERNRESFGDSAHTSETQRKFQSGTRVFPMLRMNTDGMRRHAYKTPGLRGSQERRHAQRRHAQRLSDRLRSRQNAASFCAWFVWPRFKWNCAFRRAHLALRDATSLSLAMAQQTELPN